MSDHCETLFECAPIRSWCGLGTECGHDEPCDVHALQRAALATATGVPPDDDWEVVKASDLTLLRELLGVLGG